MESDSHKRERNEESVCDMSDNENGCKRGEMRKKNEEVREVRIPNV